MYGTIICNLNTNTIFNYFLFIWNSFNVSCTLPKLLVWIRNMSTQERKLHLSINVKAFFNLWYFKVNTAFPSIKYILLLGVNVILFFIFCQKCHKMPFSAANSWPKSVASFVPIHTPTLPSFICKWQSDTINLLIKGLGVKPVLLKSFPKCWETGNNPALLNQKICLNFVVNTLKNRSRQSNRC